MGKALVILMLVLGVWLGVEIFTKGTDAAFGGIFAPGIESVRREPAEPPMQRIRERVQRDLRAGAARSAGENDSDEETGDDE